MCYRMLLGGCLKRRKSLSPAMAYSIESKTIFNHSEVVDMYEKFMGEFPKGKLTVKDLIKVYGEYYPEGNPESFAKLIFNRFDINGDGYLDFTEFMLGLAVINRGTIEEKLRFIFSIFDDDDSGFISMSEMLRVIDIIHKMIPLHNCTPQQRAEYLFNLVDANNDGDISLEEFINAVKDNAVLIYPIPI